MTCQAWTAFAILVGFALIIVSLGVTLWLMDSRP
jgi:hypothetical protein